MKQSTPRPMLTWAMTLVFALACGWSAAVAAEPSEVDAASPAADRQLLVMLHMAPPHFRPDTNYSGRYAGDAARSARHRIAENIARTHGLKMVSDWPMPALGVDCYVMEAADVASLKHIIDAVSRDERVEWAQALSSYHSLSNNDALYPLQPGAKYWHLSEIHQFTTGRKTRVAIIDSGIDDAHPDLLGQVALKENFIDGNPYVAEAHGTAVAGIIAARSGNGVGIEGVATGAQLMALRACWHTSEHVTHCNSFTLGKALNFAILHKAQVINLSLTGPPDRLLKRLIDVALGQGITIIGAADPLFADGGFPASYPGVLAVADQDSKTLTAGVILAPGRDIPTTAPGGLWAMVNGSSYAAAHVSGMVALLAELRPSMSAQQMRHELVGSGQIAGVIEPCAMIGRLTGSCACLCSAVHAANAVH